MRPTEIIKEFLKGYKILIFNTFFSVENQWNLKDLADLHNVKK